MANPLDNVDLEHLLYDSHLNGQNDLQQVKFIIRRLKVHVCSTLLKVRPYLYPNFQICDNDDSQISTCLWGSITTEISRNYIFYFSACEIWEALAHSYFMQQDISTCYELESKIIGAK